VCSEHGRYALADTYGLLGSVATDKFATKEMVLKVTGTLFIAEDIIYAYGMCCSAGLIGVVEGMIYKFCGHRDGNFGGRETGRIRKDLIVCLDCKSRVNINGTDLEEEKLRFCSNRTVMSLLNDQMLVE
jgi:hypothetical protein